MLKSKRKLIWLKKPRIQQKGFKSLRKLSEVTKEEFAKKIIEFDINRSPISFKSSIVGLINQYPTIKNSSLSF